MEVSENERQSSPASRAEDGFSDLNPNDEGQTVCPNCGAVFSVDEARCPYCNALNPTGAEKAYMEALDDLKNETSELPDEAEDDFEADLGRDAKKTVAIVCIILAAIASLFLVTTCMDKHSERQQLEAYQAREAFRAQYFEEFDRLYEAGDDDALSAYVWSLSDDPGFDALFSWKHVDFLEVHDDWEGLKSASELIESGEATLDDYTWSVSIALRLVQLDGDETSSAALSQDEEARVVAYRAYGQQFLQNTLQMSESEIAAFADEAKDAQGHVQEDKLKRPLEARLKQLGTLR